MLEFIAQFKDVLQLILNAFPGVIISILVYSWQKQSKQLEIISSVKSSLLGNSQAEQDFAFSLLLSLPNKPMVGLAG